MKKIIYILLLTTFIVTACRKKTEVTGVVYSKNNIPVPNVQVECRYYKESSYPEGVVSTVTTNSNGEFQIQFKAQKLKHEIKCFCDSGYATSYIDIGKTNTIDLHLN